MAGFLARRAIYSVVALLGVVTGVFFLTRSSGSPAYLYLPADASPEMAAQFDKNHGFDQPLWLQFFHFVADAARLDFGDSLYQHRPAIDAVFSQYPITLLLGALTIGLAVVVGVTLGCIAAAHRHRPVDRVIVTGALAMTSTPQFWIALALILVVADRLRLLPTSGLTGPASYVLPVITLALLPTGVFIQVVRGAMIEALGSSYVLRSRALGLGTFKVFVSHALRNASLPIATVVGDQMAQVINGVIIASTVFALPGIGTLLYNSVLNRDYSVIQATVLVTGAGVLVLNFLIDILYAVLDPRVRLA